MEEPSKDIIDTYKYHVVEFLDSPFKDTETVRRDFVCVPRSWVKRCNHVYNIVKIWYPIEDTGKKIEEKVMKREKKSEHWQSFLCVLKYSNDFYEEARRYIRNQKCSPTSNTEDHTPQSEKEEERPCKTTTTLKRKAPEDPDKPVQNKRSIINEPGKSVEEVAGPSSQAFSNQTFSHKASNKDLCKQGTPVVKSNGLNSTMKKKKQTVSKNASKAPLRPKSAQLQQLVECCEMILELQKCLEQRVAMKTDNSRSAVTDDNIVSVSSDEPVQAPKLNEEKTHEKQPEENDCDDDDDEPKTKKCPTPRQPKPFVLPPNYDPNDSRWTLKHRGPGPGLVELMERSGVYVRAASLHYCNTIASDSNEWSQRLLSVVFNENALRTCSWTGMKPPGNCSVVRPGLDATAREALLDYVIKNTDLDSDYDVNKLRKDLIKNMYSTMLEMRKETS